MSRLLQEGSRCCRLVVSDADSVEGEACGLRGAQTQTHSTVPEPYTYQLGEQACLECFFFSFAYPAPLYTDTRAKSFYQSYLPFFFPPPGVYGFLKSAWSTAVKSRFIPGERAVSTLLGSFAVARAGRG